MNSRKNFLGVVHLVTERYQNLYIHWNSINEKEDGQTKRSYIQRHFQTYNSVKSQTQKRCFYIYFICRLKGKWFLFFKGKQINILLYFWPTKKKRIRVYAIWILNIKKNWNLQIFMRKHALNMIYLFNDLPVTKRGPFGCPKLP